MADLHCGFIIILPIISYSPIKSGLGGVRSDFEKAGTFFESITLHLFAALLRTDLTPIIFFSDDLLYPPPLWISFPGARDDAEGWVVCPYPDLAHSPLIGGAANLLSGHPIRPLVPVPVPVGPVLRNIQQVCSHTLSSGGVF